MIRALIRAATRAALTAYDRLLVRLDVAGEWARTTHQEVDQ